MNNSCKWLLAATCLSAPLAAQTPTASDPANQAYADSYGVSQAEAAARMARLAEISRVEKALMERFPNQFGGLYVEHQPTFRVVVKMTGNGQGLLRQITQDPLFIVEQAATPVRQLMQLKERIGRRIAQVDGLTFSVAVNVWDGTVDVTATDAEQVRGLLTNDLRQNSNIRITQAEMISENTATIYGGRQLTGTQTCTSGFTINSDSGQGIVTAGHCDDRMTLSGVTFNVVSRAYKNSDTWGFDLQTMRPASGTHTFPNQTYSDRSTLTAITQVYYAADLPLNWSVCVYGTVTNTRRCGNLTRKWEVLRDNRGITNSVFRVSPTDGRAMSTGGDSGGPVLGANAAYGLIKAKGGSTNPNDLYFVDIMSLEALGGPDFNPRVKIAP